MENARLKRNFLKIEENILNRNLKDALDLLKELVIKSKKGEYILQYETLDSTYENLLKYSIDGVQDPEREKIYKHLQLSILELSDIARQTINLSNRDLFIYNIRREIEQKANLIKEEALNDFDDLSFDETLNDILESTSVSYLSEKEEFEKRQDTLIRIFNLIWLTDKFKNADTQLIESLWKAESFPWYERSIIISSLTLSTIRCFDMKKASMLMNFVKDKDSQIKQRALVGLFLVLHIYDKRLHFYPELMAQLESLAEDNDLEKHIELIAIQLLKSQDTEKISRKLEDEILPEVAKMQPKIKDKLDLDNILSSDFMEDKNPDWERVFEDSPDLLDKLQEISKLQMEGADVFMSAFSRLKHFDFFNDLINWFRPFHKDNFVLRQALSSEDENFNIDAFLDGMSKSFFMCNSDKYSFCLNINLMPGMQKTMMMEMFNAEMESIKELQSEDKMLNNSAATKSIYSQYIHDLYRFYKLHPMKNEFLDVFIVPFNFYDSHFFNVLIKDQAIFRNLAEFYFEQEQYSHAIDVYKIINKQGDSGLEIFEKIAFCNQKLKNYEEALEYYEKAELYDANRAWNLKKLALCHRYLKNYAESLKYYLEAQKHEPNNLYIQTYIGHSYLDLKEFDKALEYYYKVEFLAPDNKKVLRPIAWCSFITGKFDQAKKYYENLIEEEANKYDFMNLGHVEWCIGDRKSALKCYKLSINRGDNNLKMFLAGFEEDKKYLLKHGINPEEIPLMIDYLKYQL
jgi:tetratricopeptide (TPR) repeat protein